MARRPGVIPKTWIVTVFSLLLFLHIIRHPPNLHGTDARYEENELANSNSSFPNPPFTNTFVDGLDPIVYDPYPKYNSSGWSKIWRGEHVSCNGPAKRPVNEASEDMLLARFRPQREAAQRPFLGSYEDTDLDSRTCIDGRARYRPYGYSEEGVKTSDASEISWSEVRWGTLQRECIWKNHNRYNDMSVVNSTTTLRHPNKIDVESVDETLHFPGDVAQSNESGMDGLQTKPRTAIVFQLPASKEWTVDTVQYLRSIIIETCLHTGGEYELILLVAVRDEEGPIFNNAGVHKRILDRSTPKEFQDLVVLFNMRVLRQWYPKTYKPPHPSGQLSHDYQPLQLLSIVRPDIEFFWFMDYATRYTGHHYEFLEKIATWTRNQPRDISWQRTPFTYVPGIHRTWENFSDVAENLSRSNRIRGANITTGVIPVGPEPPFSFGWNDGWGRGEEADLVAVGAISDSWSSEAGAPASIENYVDPVQRVPWKTTAFPKIIRLSKRLLRAMHHGQVTLGTNMPTSMYPASTALHHGLKVATFPVPIFFDCNSSAHDVERTLNSDASFSSQMQKDVASRMTLSVVEDDKPAYGDELYKRWLGYDTQGTEGLCLPGMLLGPIRGV